MKYITILLYWLIESKEIKLNTIIHNMPNQLVYSIIFFSNIAIDEIM